MLQHFTCTRKIIGIDYYTNDRKSVHLIRSIPRVFSRVRASGGKWIPRRTIGTYVAAALNCRRRASRDLSRRQMRRGRSRETSGTKKYIAMHLHTPRRPRGTSSKDARWYSATATAAAEWRHPHGSGERHRSWPRLGAWSAPPSSPTFSLSPTIG